ncbi:MAG TPA: hypothetical protein VEA99_18670 [Gemmatimonadaceae bacterium]|nr:hypothetical protein [Gemmatimonadaceae bacterium]
MVVGGIAVKAATRAAGLFETAGATGRITGFTRHGINRAIQRGVNPTDMLNAVKNGEAITVIDDLGRVSYRYVGQRATVILNQAGKVISTWMQGW